jgi:magnesium-transporting ATPase (P-type)
MSSAYSDFSSTKWYTVPDAAEVFRLAQTSSDGLSAAEIDSRVAVFGKNMMTTGKKRTILQMIWEQVSIVVLFIYVDSVRNISSASIDPFDRHSLCLKIGYLNDFYSSYYFELNNF